MTDFTVIYKWLAYRNKTTKKQTKKNQTTTTTAIKQTIGMTDLRGLKGTRMGLDTIIVAKEIPE